MKPEPLEGKMKYIEIVPIVQNLKHKVKAKKKGEKEVVGDRIIFGRLFDEDDIKSACKFWLKYCQNPDLLQKEEPDYYAQWLDYFTERVKLPEEGRRSYMEWLFKLAFKSLLEEENA
jgi:hypothetical protein